MKIVKTIVAVLAALGLFGGGLFLADGTKLTEEQITQICSARQGTFTASKVIDQRGDLLFDFETDEILEVKVNGKIYRK